jgi:hypothetical protein
MQCNIELVWLTRRLMPDFKTIAISANGVTAASIISSSMNAFPQTEGRPLARTALYF